MSVFDLISLITGISCLLSAAFVDNMSKVNRVLLAVGATLILAGYGIGLA